MNMFRILLCAMLLAGGCTLHTQAANEHSLASLSGQVFYRERMALPPGTTVTVRLVDVSRADAKATLLAEQRIKNPATVPVPFQLEYDPGVIDARMSYAVQAQIRDVAGQLLWTTTEHTGVLTRENPVSDIQLLVQRVSGSAAVRGN